MLSYLEVVMTDDDSAAERSDSAKRGACSLPIAWHCLYKACLGLQLLDLLTQGQLSKLGEELETIPVFTTSGLAMECTAFGAAIRIPVGSVSYPSEEVSGHAVCDALSSRLVSTSYGSSQLKQRRVDAIINWMDKFTKKANSYARSIREHVRLGPKIVDTLKGKLKLGAKILWKGGAERAFRQIFGVREGEKLQMALQCCLSTTAGPIAGTLFISTEKIAFHSDRSLRVTSPRGDVVRIPYKVMIPLRKVRRACQSENVNKPSHKYIQITTVDNFEFWFMEIVSCNRYVKYVQKAPCYTQ